MHVAVCVSVFCDYTDPAEQSRNAAADERENLDVVEMETGQGLCREAAGCKANTVGGIQ